MGTLAKMTKQSIGLSIQVSCCRLIFKKTFLQLFFHFLGTESIRNNGTCKAPCASIDAIFGIPDTQDYQTGSIHLKLYFRQLIAVKESHVSYPLESLFAELGGYMSLILGVSFMDLIKIGEKIGLFFTTLGKATTF